MAEDAASPARSHLEQLRARQREERRGRIADVRGEILEQIELGGIGPMDVFEDEHRGLLERDLFGEPASREVKLDGFLGHLVRGTQSDHRAEEPCRLVRLLRPHQLVDPAPSTSPGLPIRRVRLEDPGRLADLLRERSVAGLAVGKAATP